MDAHGCERRLWWPRRGSRSGSLATVLLLLGCAAGLTLAAGGCGGGGAADVAPEPDTASPSTAAPVQLAWPTAYHDSRLSGLAPVAGPSRKHAAWKSSLGCEAWAYCVLDAQGRVVLGGDGKLAVFSPEAGEQVWTYDTGGECARHAVVRDDGAIVASAGDRVLCLSPDGERLWEFDMGSEADAPSLGPDGGVYVGSLDGRLVALAADGSKLWEYAADAAIHSPSVGEDGALYCGGAPLVLYAFTPEGQLSWELRPEGERRSYDDLFPWVNCLQSPSIGDDGTLYAGSQVSPGITQAGKQIADYDMPSKGSLYAVSPDGRGLWEYSCGSWATMTPTVGEDGTLYAGTSCWKVVALTENGDVRWEFMTVKGDCPFVFSPPIGADGLLYAATSSGKLYCIDSSGKREWLYDSGKSWLPSHSSNNLTPPAIAEDGRLYTSQYDGTVLAFE